MIKTKKMQKSINNFLSNIIILVALIFILIILIQKISLADITVSSYCQLSVQGMQLQATHLNDLISIMNQYQDDLPIQAQYIAAKQAEYDQTLTNLYTSFGTTGNEYVMYLGKHNQEVAAYLQANPDVKHQMDTFTSQIDTLLAQYESLKGYEGEEPIGEPPLP